MRAEGVWTELQRRETKPAIARMTGHSGSTVQRYARGADAGLSCGVGAERRGMAIRVHSRAWAVSHARRADTAARPARDTSRPVHPRSLTVDNMPLRLPIPRSVLRDPGYGAALHILLNTRLHRDARVASHISQTEDGSIQRMDFATVLEDGTFSTTERLLLEVASSLLNGEPRLNLSLLAERLDDRQRTLFVHALAVRRGDPALARYPDGQPSHP